MDVVIIINFEDIAQIQAVTEIYKPLIQVCLSLLY